MASRVVIEHRPAARTITATMTTKYAFLLVSADSEISVGMVTPPNRSSGGMASQIVRRVTTARITSAGIHPHSVAVTRFITANATPRMLVARPKSSRSVSSVTI